MAAGDGPLTEEQKALCARHAGEAERLGRWLCRRKGVPWDDECAGECLLAAVHAARRWAGAGPFGAYLARAAKRRLAKLAGRRVRAAGRLGPLALAAHVPCRHAEAARRRLEAADELAALDPGRLPARQRDLLGQVAEQGASAAARALGVTRQAVWWRMEAIRRGLRGGREG